MYQLLESSVVSLNGAVYRLGRIEVSEVQFYHLPSLCTELMCMLVPACLLYNYTSVVGSIGGRSERNTDQFIAPVQR